MPAGAGLVDGPSPAGYWKSSAWPTGFESLGGGLPKFSADKIAGTKVVQRSDMIFALDIRET